MSRQICSKCGGKLVETPHMQGAPQLNGVYQTYPSMVCHPCQLSYDSDEFVAAIEIFLSGRKLPELEPVYFGTREGTEVSKAENEIYDATAVPITIAIEMLGSSNQPLGQVQVHR